jgi:hypothetical protein
MLRTLAFIMASTLLASAAPASAVGNDAWGPAQKAALEQALRRAQARWNPHWYSFYWSPPHVQFLSDRANLNRNWQCDKAVYSFDYGTGELSWEQGATMNQTAVGSSSPPEFQRKWAENFANAPLAAKREKVLPILREFLAAIRQGDTAKADAALKKTDSVCKDEITAVTDRDRDRIIDELHQRKMLPTDSFAPASPLLNPSAAGI